MLQPFPDTACRHHTPAGLANSSIAGTLQHIMQVPQARPGTRRGRFSKLAVPVWTPYLQRKQYPVNAVPSWVAASPRRPSMKILHLAACAAVLGVVVLPPRPAAAQGSGELL